MIVRKLIPTMKHWTCLKNIPRNEARATNISVLFVLDNSWEELPVERDGE